MSLKEFMKPLACFYYVCGLVLFLAPCDTIQCFEGLGTVNKMDGRFLSSVLTWVCSSVFRGSFLSPQGHKCSARR